ncbi:MAG: GlsB/YeaQ/YmgE family stress response membrane protein [Pirellulales bacterium]|nr:GlsB/YeaQ/YmgE family stress response membrane protein [Planctomycetales bacterium]
MGILSWIVFGLIAGVLAKWIMPGADPGGIIVTILLGVIGAFVGGYVGTLLGLGTVSGFDVRSMFIAVLGAIILLALYRFFTKKS